MRFYFLLY